MPVYAIDTIKPKNNGSFPVCEAADVKISDSQRLPAALDAKANQSALDSLNTTVGTKASLSDLNTTNAVVATKASQSDLTALSLTVEGKADASDVTTATSNLQSQIDNIVTPVTQDAEVQNARVGADGTSYTTLKERLDTEITEQQDTSSVIKSDLLSFKNDAFGIESFNIDNFTKHYYITTSGDTADVTQGTWSAIGLGYCVIDCQAGDMFTIFGMGSSLAGLLWTFVSESEDLTECPIIARSAEYLDARTTPAVVVAPENAFKLIVNSTGYPRVIKNPLSKLSYCTPNMFGAKGDGINDDTTAIQTCINYCKDNNLMMLGETKSTYKITSPITFKGHSKANFNWATIVNHTNNDYAIIVDAYEEVFDGFVELTNCIIDCNGKSGLKVSATRSTFSNFIMKNVGNVAIHNMAGYESIFTNFQLLGNSDHSVGVLVNTTDGIYDMIQGTDIITAFYLNKDSNVIRGCHLWIRTASYYNSSKFIYANQYRAIHMDQCKCDTYAKFVDYAPGVYPSISASNCEVIYNPNQMPDNAETIVFNIQKEDISSIRKIIGEAFFVNNKILQPGKGTYAISNKFSNKLFPLKAINTRMPDRTNDLVDLTEYFPNVSAGKIYVKYGEYISIDATFTANSADVIYMQDGEGNTVNGVFNFIDTSASGYINDTAGTVRINISSNDANTITGEIIGYNGSYPISVTVNKIIALNI